MATPRLWLNTFLTIDPTSSMDLAEADIFASIRLETTSLGYTQDPRYFSGYLYEDEHLLCTGFGAGYPTQDCDRNGEVITAPVWSFTLPADHFMDITVNYQYKYHTRELPEPPALLLLAIAGCAIAWIERHKSMRQLPRFKE